MKIIKNKRGFISIEFFVIFGLMLLVSTSVFLVAKKEQGAIDNVTVTYLNQTNGNLIH